MPRNIISAVGNSQAFRSVIDLSYQQLRPHLVSCLTPKSSSNHIVLTMTFHQTSSMNHIPKRFLARFWKSLFEQLQRTKPIVQSDRNFGRAGIEFAFRICGQLQWRLPVELRVQILTCSNEFLRRRRMIAFSQVCELQIFSIIRRNMAYSSILISTEDLLSALAQLQEYQYAEQLDAIPEEDDEEQEALVKPSRTVQHHDYFELKPSHSSTTPSEEIVPSLDTKIFYRRLNDMLHGSPNSQHSRTASSCTQVDEEDNHISLIDSIVETEEGEEYQQRLRRGPSFTESEVEEWYGEQPDNGPKSAIQSLSADLKSHRFNEDACLLFLNMERSLDNLRMKYTGSSDLVAEAKWRLASIMKEMCRESAIAD